MATPTRARPATSHAGRLCAPRSGSPTGARLGVTMTTNETATQKYALGRPTSDPIPRVADVLIFTLRC
jgi:hypothetical protein